MRTSLRERPGERTVPAVDRFPAEDLVIPGADHSFGQLQLALTRGNFESLGRQRRPVIRLHLTGGAEQGLAQLETILNSALGKRRTVSP